MINNNNKEATMSAFEIAKEHFSKTDKDIIVTVHGNDYELCKTWFEAWVDGEDRILLYRVGKHIYRNILTKNIKIKGVSNDS